MVFQKAPGESGMLQTITLTPDGVLRTDRPIDKSNPIAHLGSRLILSPGCSLRAYFRMIERYPILEQINPFLPPNKKRFLAFPESNDFRNEQNRLVFSRTIEMIGFPGEPRIDIFFSLEAFVGNAPGDLKTIPMNFLVDLNLELGKLKHIVFGDPIDTIACETVYTLFDFIDGIAWNLEFHQTPEACRIGGR
jgi:hypothetical protein